jgi:hypothetical protein
MQKSGSSQFHRTQSGKCRSAFQTTAKRHFLVICGKVKKRSNRIYVFVLFTIRVGATQVGWNDRAVRNMSIIIYDIRGCRIVDWLSANRALSVAAFMTKPGQFVILT